MSTTLANRRSVRRSVAAIAAAALLPFIVAGCGQAAEKIAEKSAEKAIEKGGDGKTDVDIDGDNVKIESSDGTFESGTKLPSDFPKKDVPLLGKVQAGAASTTAQGKGWTVSTVVDGSASDAFKEASDALKDAGYTEGFSSGGTGQYTGKFQVLLSSTDNTDGTSALVYIVTEVPAS